MKARLSIVGGPGTGRVIELEGQQDIVIGRATDVGVSLPVDTALSRQHARISLDPPRLVARDLQSKHGMFVNGRREYEAGLVTGDRLQVGETLMQVELEYDPVAATLANAQQTARGWAPSGSSSALAKVAEVKCRCGAVATTEHAYVAEDGAVYLCARCQADLAIAPVLPAGYALVRILGQGAMGCVYLARDLATQELRAIKQILPKVAMSAQMRAMFAREASVQAQLDHPHIVRVYGLVEPIPGSFSIVMEYIDGESADALVRDGRRVAPDLAISIGLQALDGLAHAHSQQIVHRDIKEANLMLIRDAAGAVTVKVADFGLAKNFHESGASGITTDGALGGTLPYMSNEQLLDFKYVKPPADIYALGATLYRLLTGEFPRDYADGANWIRISLEEPIVPLRQRASGRDLPPALCAVIEKALEPDVKRRYQTAAEMRKALAAVR